MDIEAEIRVLKRRVDELEGTIHVLTGQIQTVRPEITALSTSANQHFTAMQTAVKRLDDHLGRVDLQVWSLRDDLPVLVSAAVRRALAEGNDGLS